MMVFNSHDPQKLINQVLKKVYRKRIANVACMVFISDTCSRVDLHACIYSKARHFRSTRKSDESGISYFNYI